MTRELTGGPPKLSKKKEVPGPIPGDSSIKVCILICWYKYIGRHAHKGCSWLTYVLHQWYDLAALDAAGAELFCGAGGGLSLFKVPGSPQ